MFFCTITCESLDVKSSFYLQGDTDQVRIYEGHRVRVKVTGQEEQKARNSMFSQCKTSMGNKSGSRISVADVLVTHKIN